MAAEQVKDMQAVTTKAVEEAAKPAKQAFERAVKDFKIG